MLQRTVTVKEVTVALVNKETNEVVFDTFNVPKQCITEKDVLSQVKEQLCDNFTKAHIDNFIIAYIKDIKEVTSLYKMSEVDFMKYGTKIEKVEKGD